MKKSSIFITALVVTLVGSNAWWASRLFDAGVTFTYMTDSLDSNREALAQSLAVISAAAKRGATRDSIIGAAREAATIQDSYEKDGYVWVGKIGLQFDSEDRLVAAARAWDPQ